MKALDTMIMGLADSNQDLSQRCQLAPSPWPNYKQIAPLAHWLFTVLIALLSPVKVQTHAA